MSRISLMVLVVLALVMSQLVSMGESITVADADGLREVTARGGAGCVMDWPGGICMGTEKGCVGQFCVGIQSIVNGQAEIAWTCYAQDINQVTWMWWQCVSIPDNMNEGYVNSTRCNPPNQGSCFDSLICPQACDFNPVNNLHFCSEAAIGLPEGDNYFFDSQGDGIRCFHTTGPDIASKSGKSNFVLAYLPTFTK